MKIFKNKYIILVIILFPSILTAQLATIDSIETLILELEGIKKVDALNDLSYIYRNVSPDKVLEIGNQALDLAKELKYKKGTALAYGRISIAYFKKSNYDKMLDFIIIAMDIFKEIDDKEGIAFCLNGLGVFNDYLGNYDKALEYYFESMKVYEEIGNTKGTGIAYMNLGAVYNELQNYEKALENHQKSLSIFEKTKDNTLLAMSWNYIGDLYSSMEIYEKALEFSLRSIEMYTLLGLEFRIAESSNNIGHIYTKIFDFEKAEAYLINAQNISKKLNAIELTINNYENYSKLYYNKKDFKKSYDLHLKYSVLKDSIFTSKSATRQDAFESNIDSETKEKELLLLNSEKSISELKLYRNTIMTNSFIGGFAFLLIIAIVINNRYKIKLKAHEALKEYALHIKRLEGFLPICSGCKKIRTNNSDPTNMKNWIQLEKYISEKTNAEFSQGICPNCRD